MRPVHPNFRIASRAADSPIRTLCEAQAEQRGDILRTKADLQSADTFTARAADFTAANSLTAAAATVEAVLASAPAANALYEAHFKVTITPIVPGAGTNTHTVVVAVETDPLASGVWTEQWTFTYEVIRKTGEPATAVVWPSERLPVRVAGIAAGGKLRLKIKTATGPGGWTFAVHGFNLATDLDLLSGVTYHTGPAIDFLDGGGATLADIVVSKISLGTSDGYELDLGGPALSPDVAPFIVARTVWGKDDSADIAIDRFTAQLHPKQNGANPKDVVWFICQPYALRRSGPSGSQNAGALTELLTDLVPLCDPVRVPAGDGTTAQDYVFSFYDRSITGPGHTIVTLLRKPRPKSIRPEFIRRDGSGNLSLLPESEYDGSATTFWFIWAVTADGTPATNVGWARDSGVTEVVNGSRKLRTVQVRRLLDQWFVEAPTGLGATARPAFRCKIETGSYAAAELDYTGGGNLIDLGATPTETVEFAAVAGVPDGCGSVFEVRNDADSAWLPFTDGQTAAEVGVSQRQTYKVRWRASPNGATDATPTLWEIGVRDVKKVWLSDLIANLRARWSIPDVAELVPSIPEAEIVLIKNGEHEFNDRVTKLLSTNTLGSLAFRVWRGNPARPRAEWLHKDDFALMDDYEPGDADVTIIAHSPLVFVNGALPVYNTTTQKREPLQLANKTPKQVYAEIVNNQLAPDIPARYRGEGLIDESCLISQTIQDSDGLTQLNAIHHIAGCALSTSAGKLKSFPMFGPGAVQVLFPSQKIKWRSTSPGLRQRVPRFFVKYGYDATTGAFAGEARLISGNDILATNLKPSRIDAVTELRDDVCRWVPTEELAKRVGKRRVDTLGAGMLVWRFTSTEPHPELEFGDVVAVETDRFFARDPSQVSQRTLKGALWAICRVIEHDVEGQELAVWIQSYTDIFGGSDVASRTGISIGTFPTVSILSADAVWNGNRLFVQVYGNAGVASFKVATSTAGWPAVGTGTLVVGQDGLFDAGVFVYANRISITITPYSDAAGASVAGPAFRLKGAQAFVDGFIDDGTGKPKRPQVYTDGKYALRASETDGSTKVSDAHNNQGSMPPLAATDSPFTYASTCINNSGRGQITWSWSAFTIYRADGSTIAVPASSAGAVPAAPTVGQVAGGALGARNRNWRVALVKDKTMMGISGETAFNPGANQLAKITSPSAVAGYDGWVPLACDATINAEVQQSSAPPTAPIAFGTDWTEPVGGADINSGTVTQWNDSATTTGARAWNLPASVTRYFYPRWDVANALVGFTDALVAARSPQLAAKQNGDGFIALSSGGLAGATPAVAGTGSGGGGGGPCLDAETRVETRTRGVVALGSCQAGEELRTDGGGWTRIAYLQTKANRAWIRVRVGSGASLLMTRGHPMVTAMRGVQLAVELELADLLVIPGGLAEISSLEMVLEERTQVDLVCEPKREFWAGEGAELLLTHNAQISS